jgi:hypothetical protein
MPLRDHFHPPWSEEAPWEGFHSAWVNTMVRHLNGSLLPRRFRAFPQIHLGPFVETDVATFEQLSLSNPGSAEHPSANGGVVAWSPPEALQTLEVELPAQDVFEVRISDEQRGKRLVAVVELVSPGNKDRPEQRQAFVAKCAAYLQEQVSVVVLDLVTTRRANLHRHLLEMFSVPCNGVVFSDLYCVSYRNRKSGAKWKLDTWPYTLAIGSPLPTVPLWLTAAFAVPLDLEKSYEETCQVLRID